MGESEIPICSLCGMSERWHTPQDHPFMAVGGEASEEFKREVRLYGMGCLNNGKYFPAREILPPKPFSPREKLLIWVGLCLALWSLCAIIYRSLTG